MPKSFSTPPVSEIKTACPRCGQEGRNVSATTLESLLHPAVRLRRRSLDGFRFCATPKCDAAYFYPASGDIIICAGVRVPIFQKGAEPERLVCYCFQHTVAEIQREVRATGISRTAYDIKAKCAQSLDDCEHTNPQGSCCLGNVQRVIREATGDNQPPPSEAGGCYCH
ncbi:MAG TPA: (2Fe-2S)-binding protein [Verrucomicrobia subdivision 3 bacterium]|nr:(2Fe-2S)-binding protein [Limisphaerales bacterium]